MNEAILSLGSNIDPEKNIQQALEYLHHHFTILEISNTWQTKAVGSDSSDFLNTAVKLSTQSDAFSLKEKCLCHIEEKMGRIRQEDKNAPRTIDLDIIVFNGKVMDQKLFSLDYLILPFAELIPNYVDPQSQLALSELAELTLQKTAAHKYKCVHPFPYE